MTLHRLAPSLARLAAASLLLLAGCAHRPPPPPMPAELGPPAAPARRARSSVLSLDSSIEAICAAPAGKAVLDRDLPGLTARPEFPMFKAMTLKQLEPMSKGHITDAVLAKVAADLAALNARTGGK